MATEPLGRAEVEIRADSTKLDADMSQAEAKVQGRTTSLGKSIKRGIGAAFGPVAAVFGAVSVVSRLTDAWKAYYNAASEVGEENRKIQETIIGSGGVSAALTTLEADLERVAKSYESVTAAIAAASAARGTREVVANEAWKAFERGNYLWKMFISTQQKDLVALGRSYSDLFNSPEVTGDLDARAKQEAADAAEREAKVKAFTKEQAKLEEEAATANMTAVEKLWHERRNKIEALNKLSKIVDEEQLARAIANVNTIYGVKTKKALEAAGKEWAEEQKRIRAFENAMSSALERVAEQQRDAFSLGDLKTHISRVGDLLAKIAQQNRGMRS